MLNKFNWIILFLVFSLLIISPSPSFAWRNYGGYGDDYWIYHGSGRDRAYSEYIDGYYTSGPTEYLTLEPDYTVNALNVKNVAIPVAQPDQFTVNIPNDRGGYTAIIIKRSGNGFIGPQGSITLNSLKFFN